MPRKQNREGFGSVRKLPSGRWQARYTDDDTGERIAAPDTFATAADARLWLAEVRTKRARGSYIDHRRGERRLADFGREWIENGGSRGHLAIRTAEEYEDLLDRHIAPTIGRRALRNIDPAAVRSWYAALQRELALRAAQPRLDGTQRRSTGQRRTEQAYTLLKSILATAERDGLIGRNPCQISGGGASKAPGRAFLPPEDLARLLGLLSPHMRAAVLVILGGHVRPGEVAGLERRDLDLSAGTLTVERQRLRSRKQGVVITQTKTTDRRTVDLPQITLDALRDYLATVPKALPKAPLLLNSKGAPLTVSAMQHAFVKARAALGLDDFHLYDAKGTGLTLLAQQGATIAELMDAAGHSTAAAAMAYQKVARTRGKVLAAGLNDALAGLREESGEGAAGAIRGA
ncbi:MAG TPA: tyrosine-type recombinase/integrase [Roseomonas sp.]|jgi:integrase